MATCTCDCCNPDTPTTLNYTTKEINQILADGVINASVRYAPVGQNYLQLTLADALALVPDKERTTVRILTFLNKDTQPKPEVWIYFGTDILTWSDATKWVELPIPDPRKLSKYLTSDIVDAISDEIASGGGVVSQDQLDQTVQDITKSYGIADQTVLTSAESYTDQKIADVVDGSPEALDTLYELAKALGDDSNFATTVMDQIGQKLSTTTFENFIDNKAWTKDNLTKLSQLINNINPIKAGTRVESMDVNLAFMSSCLRYDLFDDNTTGTSS